MADAPVAASEAMVEAIVTATIVVMAKASVAGLEAALAKEAVEVAEAIPSTECVHSNSNLITNHDWRANSRVKITKA